MIQMTVSALLTCLGNIVVFSIIPFLYWLIRYRKKENFFTWSGFYKPSYNTDIKIWILIIFVVLYVAHYFFDAEFLLSEKTITALTEGSSAVEGSEWAGKGAAALLPAFLVSYIGNGICEELMFRGFICKRFIHRTNVSWGIIISAAFFGLMHVILVLLSGLEVGIDFYIYEFVYTGIAALLLGYCNEKIFKGSIWPSIILHGSVDFISNLNSIWGWW
ncbi:MAG: lysostaphin resistance A-like protein [Roseburia sp.]